VTSGGLQHRGDPARWLDEPERGAAALPLVDAHVHLFPPRVLQAIWSWFEAHGWPIRYKLHAEDGLRFLAAQGVSRVFGLHYAHTPGLARVLNAFVTELAQRHPMVIPFGTVLPGEPEAERIVAESLDDMGHAGLKLHCHVQKIAPDDARLLPIYDAAAARGKPIVLHAGREPSTDAYGFDCRAHCGIGPVRRVVEQFPTLKLIVPHLGADEWREFVALARGSDNLYLDTTMAVGGYLTDDVPTGADLLPLADRLLFGTDFPNLPYAWGRERDWLLALDVPEEARRKIASGNALRLAGLPA
jgi:predicted TIM-barrel fold metal-dependent hydrolase